MLRRGHRNHPELRVPDGSAPPHVCVWRRKRKRLFNSDERQEVSGLTIGWNQKSPSSSSWCLGGAEGERAPGPFSTNKRS